ncbi:hypothetical protein PBI_SCTP2_183 [Salicola phage SCTP-2]|nr:hypothetical protein PBI_SCTP2_183 [Salicola phage SCTP-2]
MTNKNESIEHEDIETQIISKRSNLEDCRKNVSKDLKDCIDKTLDGVDYIERFKDFKDEILKSKDEYQVDQVQPLINTSEELFGHFFEMSEFLLNLCESIKEENEKIEKKKTQFCDSYSRCIDVFITGLGYCYDFLTEICNSLIESDEMSIEDINEDSIDEKAKEYESIESYISQLVSVLEKFNKPLEKCKDIIRKIDKQIGEIMLTEQNIKGKYWCVYQPGAAIFGIGKTENEAWKDAEEWADDVSDKNWKQSFEIMPCTEELYNYVANHGTPDYWGEIDGVLTTKEQEQQLEEDIKNL